MTPQEHALALELLRGYSHDRARGVRVLEREGFTVQEVARIGTELAANAGSGDAPGKTVGSLGLRQ